MEYTEIDRNMRGIGEKAKKVDALKGGINSKVFKVEADSGLIYVYKKYKLPTNINQRNRCEAETNFLMYCKNIKVSNVPRLINFNVKQNWSILSWIEGDTVSKINRDEITQTADFFSKINSMSLTRRCEVMGDAAESCKTADQFLLTIEERLKRIYMSMYKRETSIEALEWIKDVIIPSFTFHKDELLKKSLQEHWGGEYSSSKVVSPSDIGPHNMIRDKQTINFIDFEYSGIDNLAKLTADLLLCPKSQVENIQEKEYINIMKKRLSKTIDSTWVERLKDIRNLIVIKWCLIQLNGIHEENLSSEQLRGTIDYYNKRISRK